MGLAFICYGLIDIHYKRRLMHLSQQFKDNILIVSIDGDIVLEGVQRVHKFISEQLESEEFKHLLLDLGKTRFIDSSAIGLFVSLRKSMAERSGGFALYGANAKNQEIFSITHLGKVIDIYSTEDNAVEAFT